MANLEFVTTADGSKTIYNPQIGENYHSKHGALQESRHVFLKSGLEFYLETHPSKKDVSILEVGFGTGLNYLLTADHCILNQIPLNYIGIEGYPIPEEMLMQTGYDKFVTKETFDGLRRNYQACLNKKTHTSANTSLFIAHTLLHQFDTSETFDVLYFDAFAAIHQPEMWSDQSLERCCKHLAPGGVFVTYAITGNLKRSMKALGFDIEKAPGAPGKREMLRAVKK